MTARLARYASLTCHDKPEARPLAGTGFDLTRSAATGRGDLAMPDTVTATSTLRRAAAQMRQQAEGAAAGPYRTYPLRDPRPQMDIGLGTDDETGHLADFVSWEQRTAEHLASWPPAVALSVAALLDHTASLIEDNAGRFEGTQSSVMAALIARAYLGESA